MARLPLAGVAAAALALSGLACSGGSRGPVTTDAGQFTPDSLVPVVSNIPETLALPFDLWIDPATLESSLTPRPERAGMAQGFVFDLDIANFMRPSNLRVLGVQRQLGGDLTVRIRHAHPFPAVNPTSPAVGTNRADLGYTGRLLVLADDQNVNFFGGAVSLDPTFVTNADGFAEVGNLLATGGLTNNAFPYKLLVDEALNNRVGDSNGGSNTGSYNPATGGWQRNNLTPSNTGWTGYDYLHGGQSCDITVQIASSRLSGNVSVPLAVLIKYVDPKGVGSGSKRIPPATPDPTFFAYRLPHAALDVSRISGMNTPQINDTAGSMATIQFRIRDWDAQAAVGPDSDLSDETNVALVLPATTGFPTVHLSVPAFAGAEIGPLLPSAGATGLPGSEVPYLADVTNSLGTAPPGSVYGLIRAIDREDTVTAAQDIHYGVDPVSLVADPARALRVRNYQIIRFVVQGSGVPPEVLSVTPDGTSLGRIGTTANFSAIASNSPTGWSWDFGGGTSPNTSLVGTPVVTLSTRGSFTGSVEATNAFGTSPPFPFSYSIEPFGWARTWGANGSDVVTVVAADNAGNAYVGGVFSGTVDFDPGPGTTNLTSTGATDAFIAKYNANGDFVWAHGFGDSSDLTVGSLVVDSTNRVYVVGTTTGGFDADPGPMSSALFLSSNGAYASLFDSGGTFVRAFGWEGMGVTGSAAVRATLGGADSLLIGGQFINLLGFDMDPTFGTDTAVSLSASFSHAWVASITAGGAYSWGEHYGNLLGNTTLRDLVADVMGQVRIVGSWSETTDFDPGAGTANRTAVGSNPDAYLLSLTPGGIYTDVRTWGNGNEDQAQSIAMIDSLEAVVGGWTRGASTLDIDPGPGTASVTFTDTTNGGVYLSRFDLSAVVPVYNLPAVRSWDAMGTIRLDATNALTGRIGVALRVLTSADADPGAGVVTVTGTNDPLWVVMDRNGDYINNYFFNETGSAIPDISFGLGGLIFAAGYYAGGPVDFDPNPGYADNRTSFGSNDCYLVRLTDDLLWD